MRRIAATTIALLYIALMLTGCGRGIEKITVQKYINTYESYTRKAIDAEDGFSDSQKAAMHMGLDDFRARVEAAP
jgi:hypothetical protein